MNWIKGVFLGSLVTSAFVAQAQNSVGIGVASPNKNAVLELVSTGNNQGLLVPKLSTAQRTATSFTGALSAKENGLLVFDADEKKFYFWEATQWKEVGGILSGGNGITITNNTVSTIPQDLSLVGTTLSITNNPSATPISLSAFTGNDTDDQTLTYNNVTGDLTISTLKNGPQVVNITPTGAAGGDLAGTFPNPTIASGGINSGKILDGTIATVDIAASAITDAKIASGLTVSKLTPGVLNQVLTTTVGGTAWLNLPASVTSVTAGTGLTGGTITNTGTINLSNTGVTAATYGSATQVPVVNVDLQGRIVSATTATIAGVAPGGAATGDLTGTYPNPTIAGNAVTSAKVLDGTIVNADISPTAGLDVLKIASGTSGQVLTTNAGLATVWANLPASVTSITAGTGLTGGTITTTGTINLNNTGVTAATYGSSTLIPVIGVDLQGRIISATTAALPAFGTVTSVATGTGLTGGPFTTSGTIALANTGVAANTYGSATTVPVVTVDLQGRITTATTATIAGVAPGGAATGDLTGNYPNPTIAGNAVTSAKILDGTILDADIAGLNVSKLTVGNVNEVLTTSGGVAQWAPPGGSALINAAGTNNLFAGATVGGSSATDNAFFGANAGAPAATGGFNVAVGSKAGRNNPSGTLNTLVGWLAGGGVATGAFNGNTFIGAQAGQVATGGPNTFIGEKSGSATSTGTQNLFAGNSAGLVNTTGTQLTLLGYFADVSTANLQNATAIGYNTKVDASNKVRIGNTTVAVIEGQVAYTNASDRRFKTNIQPLAGGLDLIMKLKPVSYNMKASEDQRLNWGFIAQDIEALVGRGNAVLTVGTDKDNTLGLRYSDFIAPLVKAVQEQQDQIAQLSNKLGEREKKIAALEALIRGMESDKVKVDVLMAEIEKIKKAVGLKADIR